MQFFRQNLLIGFMTIAFFSCQSPKAKFESHIFEYQGFSLSYQLLKPPSYTSNKKYPIIIHLHGSDERGNDSRLPLKRVEKYFLQNQQNFPTFVLVPQCPSNLTWKNPILRQTIMNLLQELQTEFSLDANSIYLTGLSMGGFGVWHFLEHYPDFFAAGVIICGGGNPHNVDKLKNIPVWLFHSADDNNVAVKYSREMIYALKKAGGTPKYTEYQSLGHNAWDRALQEKEMWAWLFKQKKNKHYHER